MRGGVEKEGERERERGGEREGGEGGGGGGERGGFGREGRGGMLFLLWGCGEFCVLGLGFWVF